MSCVVGVVSQGIVYLGGDSARTTDSFQIAVCSDTKVWKYAEEGIVLGCTGSPRVQQVLQYTFVPPPRKTLEYYMTVNLTRKTLEYYMTVNLIRALRDCLKGEETNDPATVAGCSFLIGVDGRLFAIHGDFQWEESVMGYNAIGNASDVAGGALFATRELLEDSPKQRVRLALEAAQAHNAAVRAPFTCLSTRIT